MAKISSSRMDMEDGRLDDAILKQYGETVVGGASGTNAGASYEVAVASGNVFNLILNSATCTLTFTTPAASGTMSSFTLILRQDGTGGRLVTWPTVKWPGGSAPAVSSEAYAVNVFSFFTLDAGSTWFGVRSGAQFQSRSAFLGWGSNVSEFIGDNSTVTRSSPVQIGVLTDWSQISSKGSHTAAVKTDGTLWTWGFNTVGQLGLGDKLAVSSPVQVGTLTDWAQVSTGYDHTVATKTDGTLWAWGDNGYGQLGHNTAVTVDTSSPVQVGTLTTWSSVAGGGTNTLAVKTDGTLWAWGNNGAGQLGHNTAITLDRSSPVQVGTLTTWSSVFTGAQNSFAIRTNGTLWAWGFNNGNRLGDGTSTNRSSPVQLGTVTTWSQGAAGGNHGAAVRTDGTLWTWAFSNNGQLGHNDTASAVSPKQVGSLSDWAEVSVGQNHTIATKTDGTLWSWGVNSSGQLGHNDTTSRSSPVQVGGLTGWGAISASKNGTKAIVVLQP
ncbi:hypothetical protein IT396_01350 [Candidatus Nomurabacteria bacterium]|nr:hypothetical protein [Candidatus Nomurabacteria bacterium]